MSLLKTALLKIKSVSEKDYQLCYELMHNLFLEDVEFEGNTLEELLSELEDNTNIEIKQINGLAVTYQGKEQKLFTYPTYGWDGGSAIDTVVFNLTKLDTNDFGSGLFSSTAILKNDNYPAFVLYNCAELAEIHIF